MKKYLLLTAAASVFAVANAQTAVEHTNFGSNWSIGLDGGVATPLTHHAFFGDMRGVAGLHIEKQVSPVFGLGVEGLFGVNTSSWYNAERSHTAFDNSYVGAYGKINLTNLFCGFSCNPRVFTLDAVAGAGWGHDYWAKSQGEDQNYFVTKAGLNFNFNLSQAVTLSLKPYVAWDMTGGHIAQTTVGYNANAATFNCLVGLTYNFGKGFPCVTIPADQAGEVAALNAKVNELRAALDDTAVALAASNANSAELAAALAACEAKPATVVKETTTDLQSVRYVFFRLGSSKITADQMPNVEMIADYLKHHKGSTVVIKGYASPDGSIEVNERLAKARAESVKNSLVKKYGIAADRISAEGQGIGTMFSEESWNRVAICTIDAE